MKFGKQLRFAAIAAWVDYYVDYKGAKVLMNNIIKGLESCDPSLLAAQRAKDVQRVVNFLKKQVVKQQRFIRRQTQSVNDVVDAFSKEGTESQVFVSKKTPKPEDRKVVELHIEEPGHVGLVAASGGNMTLQVTSEDGQVADLSLLGENKTHHDKTGAVAPATTSAANLETPNEASEADPEAVAASTLHGSLTRLQRRLSSLFMFLQLNHKALSKMCKKVQKRLVANNAPKSADHQAQENDAAKAQDEPQTDAVRRLDSFRAEVDRKLETSTALVQQAMDRVTEVLQTLSPPMMMGQEDFVDHADVSLEFGDGMNVLSVDKLDLKKLPVATITHLSLGITTTGLGDSLRIPVIVAKGALAGPIVGITCAIHGNELNGIPIIFRLMRQLDLDQMSGIVVAAPVLNPPGFLRHQRVFSDGQDLNRLFPGNPKGNAATQYVYWLNRKLISKLEYVVDLHTASFGRINSLYVRADMTNPVVKKMALLQNPQIIVHNSSPSGSIRGICMQRKVPCVTVEVGDPSTFHKDFLNPAFHGVENILSHLRVVPDPVQVPETEAVICSSSAWSFSTHGGILTVLPQLCDWVEEGAIIAQLRNVYGAITHVYRAERAGIVIGKNVNPVCQSGDRLLHLGFIEGRSYEANVQDGH